MISEGFRVDGRHLDEVRPIYCESHHLPALHGSALFSRGDTQVRAETSVAKDTRRESSFSLKEVLVASEDKGLKHRAKSFNICLMKNPS